MGHPNICIYWPDQLCGDKGGKIAMWRWMVLLLLLGSAWPAQAAKTLSVEQMEQLLATLEGKPDGKAASELGEVQMTERVSTARLKRWEAEFPGPKTRETLMQLADMSAFLDPPASDMVLNPRPEMETQKQILRMSVQYVENTISRLPDFFATRETTHFEDTLARKASYSVEGGPTGTAPRGISGGAAGPSGTSVSEPLGAIALSPAGVATSTVFTALHSTGAYSRSVSYRGGHEVEEDAGKPEAEPALGLTSHGEFGPILAQILVDALRGEIGFARWEQGAKGPEAVFHYTVTADASHFGVDITSGGQVESVHPGYHGEIGIDPGTGAILRFTEVADMVPPYQAMRAAIAVEYAPVEIAGQSYICPSSAVAFSKIPVPTPGAKDPSTWPIQSELNDVAFAQYHEFRTESRLVASANEGGLNYPAGGSGSATPETAQGGAEPGSSATASAGSAQPAGGEAASTPANAAPMENGAAPVAPAAHDAAGPLAGSASPATVQPASNAQAKPDAESAAPASPALPASAGANTPAVGSMFHAQSKLVLVDVVVTDHDKPEKGLERSRFHVFEDGHEQPIASFEENQPPPSVELAEPPALPANTYSNLPVYPQTGAVNVLLLDALNTPMSDQAQLRRQMIQYLSTIKPGTAMAVFTMSSQLRMAAGFTTDLEKLRQALEDNRKSLGRSNGDVGADSSEGISSNLTQVASGVANNNDPGTMWLVNTIMDFAADTKTYENDQRVQMTLDAMSQLARYLAGVPGRKNVIWFSGSFPIGLAPDALSSTELKNVRDYSDQVRKTSDLLSAARVSVYPVDARGVLTQATADVTYTPPPIGGRQNRSVAVQNDNTSFAEQNSLEQGSMNTIATETGGHVFATGNDLPAAIQKITANDAYYYALSYVPPETKAGRNGDFHSIEVKVEGAKYQLAYRRGYYSQEANKAASAPGKETSPMVAAALAGAPPATQILFQARVLPEGAPELHDAALEDKVAGEKTASFPGGTHRYVVDLSVRAEDLTFTKIADGVESTELDCELVAYDEKRQVANSLGRGYNLKLSAEQYQRATAAGGVIPLRLAMDLPAGNIGLRVVVFDTGSARTGSLEIPVAVAAKPAGAQANSAQ